MMSENNPNSRREARQKRVQKVIKYLGLSGTGIGISAIVGFLVKGQFKAVAVSALLTVGVTILAIAYKFVSGVTNRVLDKIEEELENLEEPLANWIVNQPKRFFTWLWWSKLNSQFQNQYYESLIDTFRELKNAFGLYDMHGNVWEWCQDNWHGNYQDAPTDGSAWLSGGSSNKVARGGSWPFNPDFSRSACRHDTSRDNRIDSVGFRVVSVAFSTR